MRLSSILTASLFLAPLAAQHGFTPQQHAELRAIIRSEIRAAMQEAHGGPVKVREPRAGRRAAMREGRRAARLGEPMRIRAARAQRSGECEGCEQPRGRARGNVAFGGTGFDLDIRPEIVQGKDGTFVIKLEGLEGLKELEGKHEHAECEVHVIDPQDGHKRVAIFSEEGLPEAWSKFVKINKDAFAVGKAIEECHGEQCEHGCKGECTGQCEQHHGKAKVKAGRIMFLSGGDEPQVIDITEGAELELPAGLHRSFRLQAPKPAKEECGGACGGEAEGECSGACGEGGECCQEAKPATRAHGGAIMMLQGSGEPKVIDLGELKKNGIFRIVEGGEGHELKLDRAFATKRAVRLEQCCEEGEKAAGCCGEEKEECSGACGEGGECCQEPRKAAKPAKGQTKTFTFVINGEGQTSAMKVVPCESKAATCGDRQEGCTESKGCAESKECAESKGCTESKGCAESKGCTESKEAECSGACGEGGTCCQEKAGKAGGCGTGCGGETEQKAETKVIRVRRIGA